MFFLVFAFHFIVAFLYIFCFHLRGRLVVFAFMIVHDLHVDFCYDFLFVFDLFAAYRLEKTTLGQFRVRCVLWFTAHWSSICIISAESMSKESFNVFWWILSRVNAWRLNWLRHLLLLYLIFLFLDNTIFCNSWCVKGSLPSNSNIFPSSEQYKIEIS